VDQDVRDFFATGKVCGDDLGVIDGKHTGVVRISFGTYSTLKDVDRWMQLLEEEFLDQVAPIADSSECAICDLKAQAKRELRAKAAAAVAPVTAAAPMAPREPEKLQIHSSELILAAATPLKEGVSAARTPPSPQLAKVLQVHPTLNSNLSLSDPAQANAGDDGLVVAMKVYPVKGCGALNVKRWPLDPSTGALFLDRRWCLAAASGSSQRYRPISTKQAPLLAQVQFSLRRRGAAACKGLQGETGSACTISDLASYALVLSAPGASRELEIPLSQQDGEVLRDSKAEAVGMEGGPAEDSNDGQEAAPGSETIAEEVTKWFEEVLARPSLRLIDAEAPAGTGEPRTAKAGHFANAPSTLLLVSTASLKEFGRQCGLEAPSERFRANLEVDFHVPWVEAEWPVGSRLQVGDTEFEAAGRCIRCQAVDINPENPTTAGPSLLAALATAQAQGGAGGGGKGPTFGTLLRPNLERLGSGDPERPDYTVLSLGTVVRHGM